MSAARPAPFFLPADHGRLFCVAHRPQTADCRRGAILVPPFAEEMNRSRRQMFLFGRTLATAGILTILPDLYGTGDSDGDLREAEWSGWQRDIVKAAEWLQLQGVSEISLIGLRLGALLAASLSGDIVADGGSLVLVQPVINGEQFVTQFLRLRLAADMVRPSESKLTTADLRRQLQDGDVLEVAGYPLSPALAHAIDELKMADLLAATDRDLCWYEVSAQGALSPAASRLLEKLQPASLRTQVIAGEPFWSTQEIAVVPALAESVASALKQKKL